MNLGNIDDEDEDVVIKNSSLYKHLQKFGYKDFESVAIEKLSPKNELNISKLSSLLLNVKTIFQKFVNLCSKIIQDDSTYKKQLEAILSANVLLSDHTCAIYNLLEKYESEIWRTPLLKFVLLGIIVSSPIYTLYNYRYRNLAIIFGFIALCSVTYIQYVRTHVYMDLKSVICLQNKLFDLLKKAMKILRYGYNIKLSKGKDVPAFSELAAGRLIYLQPIMENLVKCLQHISSIYYQASTIILNLLPNNDSYNDLLTRLENTSFEIRGEINYQKLKIFYHTYILTQSEMLHLLAIAYDNHTWKESHKSVPEVKLFYVVSLLLKCLTKYENKLSEIIKTYYNFKLGPIPYKYRGPYISQWQDLYMQLHLASNKLQLAYGHILSILEVIDNTANDNTIIDDSVESIMKKLNATQTNIETAKDFVEFGNLLFVKSQMNHGVESDLETSIQPIVVCSAIKTITDSETETLDEVFEEYIKEEYMKPMSEDTDKIALYDYKRDKILFKNFLAELKDALVEKQKSMSEREANALKRMYDTLMKDMPDLDNNKQRIPTPPPMPSFHTPSFKLKNNETPDNLNMPYLKELSMEALIVEHLNENDKRFKEKMCNNPINEEFTVTAIPLPRNKQFSSSLPPPFLKAEEETFIGSGENSEEEINETEIQ